MKTRKDIMNRVLANRKESLVEVNDHTDEGVVLSNDEIMIELLLDIRYLLTPEELLTGDDSHLQS